MSNARKPGQRFECLFGADFEATCRAATAEYRRRNLWREIGLAMIEDCLTSETNEGSK